MFPLTWLVLLGLLIGNATVDPATDLPLMQLVTPTAAAMGVLFAAYPTVATATATPASTGCSNGSMEHRCRPGSSSRAGPGRRGDRVRLVRVMVAVGAVCYGWTDRRTPSPRW